MRGLLLGLVVVVLLPALSQGDDSVAKKKAIAYVVGLQNEDGGFQASGDSAPSSLGATTAAIRALKYFGGELPRKNLVTKFVAACYDPDSGSFADTPGGKPTVRTTAVGVMAAAELEPPSDAMKAKVAKYLGDHAEGYEGIRIAIAGLEAIRQKSDRFADWTKQIASQANADGTWGKGDAAARDTGGSAVIILRAGVPLKNESAVLKTLEAGLRPDGGYGKADARGSDLETTYRVMRCYHMLGKQPGGAAKIRDFVAKCQNADGGFGVAPGQPSSASATYFAAIVLHWLDAK